MDGHGDIAKPRWEDVDRLLSKLKSEGRSAEGVATLLQQVSARVGRNPDDYDENLRSAFLALNIRLSELGGVAPAFRPVFARRVNGSPPEADRVRLQDLQVLDLHYLHVAHRSQARPTDPEFESLFTADTFDFDLAYRFATRNWRASVKVAALRLPESIQFELRVLREPRIKERIRTVERAAEQVEVRIRDWSLNPQARLKSEDVPRKVLEFKCLKLGAGSPTAAARFMCLHGFKPVPTAKRMQKAQAWLEQRAGINAW